MVPADGPLSLRQGTNGRPLPGMRLRIVDATGGEPLPAGAPGEIAVKGVTCMRGYYKVAPENAFDEDGFFRTQDGGSIDPDGFLHWTGRLSNLIKTGGANVSPVEIEEALERHPAVKVGIPVGIEHPTLELLRLEHAVRKGVQLEIDDGGGDGLDGVVPLIELLCMADRVDQPRGQRLARFIMPCESLEQFPREHPLFVNL